MKIISFEDIKKLSISPSDCLSWVEDVLINKYKSCLPPKVSIKLSNDIFFNTMPSYLPDQNRFGVKVVSRFPNRKPALIAEILLYDSNTGDLLALIDGSWITTMRTGAVAALSIRELQSKQAKNYAFIGLGNTARATLVFLQSIFQDEELNIGLLEYKGQEKIFKDRFKDFKNLKFTVFSDITKLIEQADVVVSCVTATDILMAPDLAYKEGVLVVPVHSRGFQNCDLFFDKVFADDREHVKDFKYFDRFACFDEFSQILLNNSIGRNSDRERILAYNIGISLHDIYFASQIFTLINDNEEERSVFGVTDKFWV